MWNRQSLNDKQKSRDCDGLDRVHCRHVVVCGGSLSTNQVTDYLILMITITTADNQTSVFDLVLA